jgi:putative membrane protein insertion efficiency factor
MSKIERILGAVLCGFILLYRYSFAMLFGGRCRFTPSCSAYALEAVRIHGPARGGWLALKRLGRCHPWGRNAGNHGFNPVPPRVK